ncbi:MAG TPA: DUF1573 domain-containing protein [Planctomycetaceae bacterium]|nr:DUF1573 domain-containing protein [Planctomycetaceae bacterium]
MSLPVRPMARTEQVLQWCAILIPALFSVAAVAIGPRAQAIANVPELPALAFDQYLVDLREVPPTDEVFGRFGFVNAGFHDVHISELVPSCGCLQPRMQKRDYKPGESGEFLLRVATANQESGPKEYRVKVKYTDPEPREREVVFKVILPKDQVFVRPRALMIYQNNSAPTAQELVVTDLRASPFKLESIRSTSDFVKVELLPEETARTGDPRHMKARVTVQGQIPPGKHQAIVSLITNDPSYPEIRVPVMVMGPKVGAIAEKTREPGVK